MNIDFLNTLSGVDKVLYKSAYNFTEKYCNGTPAECHAEGLKKIKDTHNLGKKKENWVDITTGRKVKGQF